MTAAAVLIAIPAALVFLLVQSHLVTGLTAGAHQGLTTAPCYARPDPSRHCRPRTSGTT